LCDKTTWWQSSRKVEHEVLVKDGVFMSNNQNWIDLTHGKLMNEGRVTGAAIELAANHISHENRTWYLPELPHGYLVPVIETETSPGVWEPATGYAIDYEEGYVSAPYANIRASYHHADSSRFDIEVPEGKILNVGRVETNSTGLDYDSAVAVYSIFSDGNEIDRRRYVGLRDYLSASAGPPKIYTIDGKEYMEIDWDYRCSEAQGSNSLVTLKGSDKMKVSIYTEGDKAFTGTDPWCVVSLHCTSEADL
jgi:hypothetical protein